MFSLLEKPNVEESSYQDNYTHLVEALDSQYSWCGVDVSKAKWGKGLGTSICPECDFRWKNCNCLICKESRNV